MKEEAARIRWIHFAWGWGVVLEEGVVKVEWLSGFSFIFFFFSFGSVQEKECQWEAETPGAAFKQ